MVDRMEKDMVQDFINELESLANEVNTDRISVLNKLNGLLSAFSAMDTNNREVVISRLLKFIGAELKPTSAELSGVAFTNDFILGAVNYSIQDVLSQLPNVHEGNHTIVALRGGQIGGVWENTEEGDVHAKFGNLAPYALIKAILQMHIYLKDKSIGIAGSQDELASLTGRTIFLGGNILKLNFEDFYLGASGCQFKRAFLEQFMGTNMIEYSERLGGLGDEEFLKLVVEAANNMGTDKKLIYEEPALLRLIAGVRNLSKEQTMDWQGLRELVKLRKKYS